MGPIDHVEGPLGTGRNMGPLLPAGRVASTHYLRQPRSAKQIFITVDTSLGT